MRAVNRRPLRAVLALVVTFVLPAGTANAAPRTAHGRLTGDTTVTWSGAAGIALDTTGSGTLPDDAMTLTVRGGTYAFVTLLANPQPAGCLRDIGTAHCDRFMLGLYPHSGDIELTDEPGRDHFTLSSRPPLIDARRYDAYLLTDGVATLRLRPPGYRGTSSYVAAGRIRGRARPLPHSCTAPGCVSTPAAVTTGGGDAYDFGSAPGQAQVMAWAIRPPPYPNDGTANTPRIVQACLYPGPEDPTVGADPASHPYGCDAVPGSPGDAPRVAFAAPRTLHVGTGDMEMWFDDDVVGKRYGGFFVGVRPGDVYGGYAVWLTYGIR